MVNMERFARRCDATGKGINEGYVVGDGELYYASKDDLLDHLKSIQDFCGVKVSKLCKDDDELLEFFYDEDYYYYTEWEEIDDDCYYDAEGNEYEN
jgi:hypothetical protein